MEIKNGKPVPRQELRNRGVVDTRMGDRGAGVRGVGCAALSVGGRVKESAE